MADTEAAPAAPAVAAPADAPGNYSDKVIK